MSRANLDLIVVGAGAAGLAAGRRARELGLGFAILEAKDRIGGRAHTDTETFGVPWDRGAHWLHQASHNLFTGFADAEGIAYQPPLAPRRLWSDGWADAALEVELDAYYAKAFAAIQEAGAAGLDLPASEVIPAHPRFRAMFDSLLAAVMGADPERLSTLDYARYRDGSNLRVVDGYGALVARFGRGLPVELRTPARRIRWRGKAVAVETPRGTLEARAVLVTAPTDVLALGGIRFDPPLPARKQEALAAVPLGEANKVAVAFEPGAFGPDDCYRLHIEHGTPAATRFEFRAFGRELALGYLAGRFAAELEAEGKAAMAAFALDQLVKVFGSGLRRHVRGVASTAWCGDREIGGGYSCARPGFAHLRCRLAEPLAGRLFFAGEACSLDAYGTVHGAAETGAAAVEAIARRLKGGSRLRP